MGLPAEQFRKVQMVYKNREFFPSLEGIRGYAFLLVFIIHYTGIQARPTDLVLYPFFLLQNTAWFLVPIFFVLSGFLITRILLNTREREGYFRVFYFRRILRVFPLYYLVVIPIGLFGILRHWPFLPQHLLYLVYLQTLSPICAESFRYLPVKVTIAHLWSLAIEEQFYLVWPIVIWFLPTEEALLRVSYGIIATCSLLRIAWPLFHLSYTYAYYATFTRVDAIILGAVLAIHYKRRVHWSLFVKLSHILIPVVWGALIILSLITGSAWTDNYVGVAFCIPAMNLIGACFVILAIHPTGFVNRVCSGKTICHVGRLSYGLYLFHHLYSMPFNAILLPKLNHYLPNPVSHCVVLILAFSITLALAMLSYRFIEEPAMRWKDKMKYGAVIPHRMSNDQIAATTASETSLQLVDTAH